MVMVTAMPNNISDEKPATAAGALWLTPKKRAASTAIVAVTKATGTTSHGTIRTCAQASAPTSRALRPAGQRPTASGEGDAAIRRCTISKSGTPDVYRASQ
ncbi:hypothetical protein GCM10009806_00280 [Microbacterium flavum]